MKFTNMNQKRFELFYRWFILNGQRNSFAYKGVVVAGVIVLSLIWGCAAYHPMPITSEGVRARLQPPDMAQVRALGIWGTELV